jgi:hypothetical protein
MRFGLYVEAAQKKQRSAISFSSTHQRRMGKAPVVARAVVPCNP